MASSESPKFIARHVYELEVTKEDICECPQNQAIWGPVACYGRYGKWIMAFYPNGYQSNPPAKFAFLLTTADKQLGKTPSFTAETYITLLNEGCGWYNENLYEKYPKIATWEKLYIRMACSFTEPMNCMIDDRNWLTYSFLNGRANTHPSDYFYKLDLKNFALEPQNVDCTIAMYIPKFFSRKSKVVKLPMHKEKLLCQSPFFRDHYADNEDTTISFPGSPVKVVQDMVLFCYRGDLPSYDETHIAFAEQYQMDDLHSKADKFLALQTTTSNLKKMMKLTETYNLPEKSMTLYNFYLFNPKGECICYKEWRRDRKREVSQEGEFKLVYGLLLSLRSFCQRIATKDGQQFIKYFRTNGYKMNYMETATGLKLVLNSDPEAIGLPELLRTIYTIFVETVVKNPLLNMESTIESQLFHSRLDEVIKSHHSFV